MVRTPDFHPGYPALIPGQGTKISLQDCSLQSKGASPPQQQGCAELLKRKRGPYETPENGYDLLALEKRSFGKGFTAFRFV